jgi:hypothetical protein
VEGVDGLTMGAGVALGDDVAAVVYAFGVATGKIGA